MNVSISEIGRYNFNGYTDPQRTPLKIHALIQNARFQRSTRFLNNDTSTEDFGYRLLIYLKVKALIVVGKERAVLKLIMYNTQEIIEC